MKLQFKHQKFQVDAALAVCDVFAGQPYLTSSYLIEKGQPTERQISIEDNYGFTGFGNNPIITELNSDKILDNLNKVQRANQLEPSKELNGQYNLTVEMETGVGKTYTYIKTMYELNNRYGWSKFIVVVPSVAIREGVYKSFQITEEHFSEEYEKKIRFFIYNSKQLNEIDRFASDSAINVMIINSQAFNARGKDARRIYMELDEFRSRRPIDIIAQTNPIVIIDEPQSVEGKVTKERLKEFNPLMTLRYSATHKADSVYNMVYRLDAIEAYNKRLVKKIAVKGISQTGSTATNSYVYLESINISEGNPTATIEFDIKGKTGIRKARRKVGEGFDIFSQSGELEEYKNGFSVSVIDGRDGSIEFANGVKLFTGDVVGEVNEDQLRRIQIREAILSHLERERQLFSKNIKVLTLFFIDEVAKYKQYGDDGKAFNGEYADIFEEEYKAIIDNMQMEFSDASYIDYIDSISAQSIHAGYFSIDKKSSHIIDSKIARGTERVSEDVDAYDLIMKDKERLLDIKEPVKFIFSHSALREGWDNPNVFQICTLKKSGSDIRKRQEVGRGLRLSVNQFGERMDVNLLGEDVHNVNVLTIIANESYDDFSKGLQREIAEAVSDRPRKVGIDIFKGKMVKDESGAEQIIDIDFAENIYEGLIALGYVRKGILTDKYYEDKNNGNIELPAEAVAYEDDIMTLLGSIYDNRSMQPENARSNNVELKLSDGKFRSKEFKELWSRINAKSVYTVKFDEDELIDKSIKAIDKELNIPKVVFHVESGEMTDIKSKEQLKDGQSFWREKSEIYYADTLTNSSVKYDLVGKIVTETGLTRKTVASILKGIDKLKFDQFVNNPEDFIIRISDIINEQKATVIIQHITYDKLESSYDSTVFTEPTMKGQLGANAIPVNKHLYDYVIYDSTNEKKFAEDIDVSSEVAVYVKLPKGFYINTPVGKYNPDWAIAFHEDKVKHIYFVAETKGSMSSMQLRLIEESRIHCAKEHFKAISSKSIVYNVVDSYDSLMNIVMK